MSDYGADPDPSIPAAQQLAYTFGFMPLDKTNVMQWTYPDDVIVRKLANKTGKSNVLFKFAEPPPPGPIPPDLDPVPAGDACSLCWGNSKPFGVGDTPESVVVVIQDIEKGSTWMPADGEPPDGIFILTQIGGTPCGYALFDADFSMFFNFGPVAAGFSIFDDTFTIFIFSGPGPICNTFFENTLTDPFVGGTATIFIPPIAP